MTAQIYAQTIPEKLAITALKLLKFKAIKNVSIFMHIYLTDIIPLIIVFQSIIFTLILITDDGPKRISNRYLSLFIFILGLQFTSLTCERFGFASNFFQSFFCVFGFAYGPLFFLYSKSLIYKSFKFEINHLYHFLPLILVIVLIALKVLSCGSIGVFIYVSLLVYLTLSIREILRFRKVMMDTQSSISLKNLIWLQWTIILFCLSLFLDIVDQFIWSMDLNGISSIHFTLLLLINWMYYKGLRQPQIFLGISESDEQIFLSKENFILNTEPSENEKNELNTLKNYITEHEVFTDPELNLNVLAEKLEFSPRHLSYLINNFLNQNFMSFINSYRIEKAKIRLKNPKDQKETISEIMYEVGFNSKSSFNTIFKQLTGYTPSEFKKKS